ncbi:hypothetical protein CH063_07769, partial [Colletotrichum higginsianum]
RRNLGARPVNEVREPLNRGESGRQLCAGDPPELMFSPFPLLSNMHFVLRFGSVRLIAIAPDVSHNS